MLDGLRVLKTLMGRGALFGDVFTEERSYTHIHLESERLEKVEKALEEGVGLRVIEPWKAFYASTNSLDTDHVLEFARALAGYGRAGETKESRTGVVKQGRYPFSIAVDPSGVGPGEKIAIVRAVDEMARRMEKRVKQARVIMRDTRQKVRIYASDGTTVEDERTQVVLNLFLIGEGDGEMQTAYEAVGGFCGFEFFSRDVLEGLVEKTVKRLAGLLTAREAPMGTKTVVLASEAGGTMIHEAIGHGLEADLAMEGLSCYKDMIGEKIASPLIDIVDDATVPHKRGTYAFDDEGVPAQRTLLVEKGVLTGYLFDRFHGLRYDRSSTGNGRRESYRYKPIPRMSNTIILPGTDDPERIIASVDDGVYVVKMGGGQVDTVRGDFVFEIAEGYLLRDGAVAEMIKNATIMGNGLEVLKGIDMVGSDLGYGIGTCGKDGQGVPVADAQPTLRIPEIIVGGRQAG